MSVSGLSRLRRTGSVRDLVAQTRISPSDIILPYFVVEGQNIKEPIPSMPGVFHFSIDLMLEDIELRKGIGAVLLFGIADKKDEAGSEAYSPEGIVQRATRAIKNKFKDLVVVTDVCLCGYTANGHCCYFINGKKDLNKTLEALSETALSLAEAGADLVAPSAMMDGQVKSIRKKLDENGLDDTGILAYSAKYASSFYGPFRDALDSAPQFGDRKTYQMDFRNADEAMREIRQDIIEGSDIVMVKPALSYLDIIYRGKNEFEVPVAAYNVSGEYTMIKNFANGDREVEKKLALEVLTSIKRAGADLIISYFGNDIVEWTGSK